MFHRISCFVLQTYANQSAFFKSPALLLLVSLSLFVACGSHSPTTNTPGPTPSSNAGLNVSAALPSASVGSNYNATVGVTGGTAPYNFSVVSGQLPTGVSLAGNTGTISGTPSATGTFGFAISVSDSTGLSAQKSLQISVSNNSAPNTGGSSSGGNSFSNLQHSGGWNGFGQAGPNYVDCSPSPCNGISFSMTQGVGAPSLSGQASEFNVGGSTPYSDALWTNHLIGTASSQGMPDSNDTLVPSLHNFTYDVYFYGDNLALAQALEFDINVFFNNMGFIFGHQCRIASGNQWDVWDNQNAHWVPTGVPCNPNNNSWNHLTIQVQRTSNNNLVYQSITFNGVTSNLNWTFPPGSSSNWYGITINYQMDGDSRQDSYNVYLDNLTFSYQ